MNLSENIKKAAAIIANSKNLLIFTGAGISVESGIPPFRGSGGLWETIDPEFIEIHYFFRHSADSWQKIKRIFYENWGAAKPNPAHFALAELQKMGFGEILVTQNIDCLHQRAGSRNVVEFHGTLDRLVCTGCSFSAPVSKELLRPDIPVCPDCGKLLKPDVVFFGEGIPEDASDRSFRAAARADAVLVVGTTGEVMPACLVPAEAHRGGARVIEVNIEPSAFTRNGTTDVFLQGKASEVLTALVEQTALCVK